MHKLKVAAIAAGMLVSGVASADLSANTTAVLFGDVPLGQSATDYIVVTNLGAEVARNLVISISGNSTEFALSGTATQSATLKADEPAPVRRIR